MREKRATLIRFFGYILLLINIIVAVWLVLCYAASVTDPQKISYLELFSLSTPFAIIANMVFVLFWLLSKAKWRAVFSLLLLVFCCKSLFSIFGLNYFGSNDLSHHTNTLKLMQWNVHGMGYFDEPHNNNASGIMELVKQEAPDILCMPEFYSLQKDSLRPFTSMILQDNGFKQYRFCIDNPYAVVDFGIAVFSKYPIRDYRYYDLGNYIYLMQCDIVLPGMRGEKIVRMFFTHLCSFYFTDNDLEFLKSIKENRTFNEKDVRMYKLFLEKFRMDYTKRANEADKAAVIIRQSPYPVLICGDMNDLPGSYTYNVVRGNLNDVFVQKGKGFGRTYNRIFPTLRIDHIFYDAAALHIIGFKVHHVRFSDHFPLIANFEIE